MMSAWDMNQSEMKHKDRDDPSIDTGRGSDIWVRQHAFNVFGIDFNNEVAYADEVELQRSQGPIKSI